MKILSNNNHLPPLAPDLQLLRTPEPPYVAVISTNIHNGSEKERYDQDMQALLAAAEDAPGFLGGELSGEVMEGGRIFKLGVLYWQDMESLHAWRKDPAHIEAKKLGKQLWYDEHNIRICQVVAQYGSNLNQGHSDQLAYGGRPD